MAKNATQAKSATPPAAIPRREHVVRVPMTEGEFAELERYQHALGERTLSGAMRRALVVARALSK